MMCLAAWWHITFHLVSPFIFWWNLIWGGGNLAPCITKKNVLPLYKLFTKIVSSAIAPQGNTNAPVPSKDLIYMIITWWGKQTDKNKQNHQVSTILDTTKGPIAASLPRTHWNEQFWQDSDCIVLIFYVVCFLYLTLGDTDDMTA